MVALFAPSHHPFRAAMFCAFGALATGCVEAPPDRTVAENPLGRLACLGEAPACLSACRDGDLIRGATCDGGIWRCESGVREDLCCDPANAPEACEEWAERCDAKAPCDAGYTCVRSQAFPIPVPTSDETGICRLGDWSLAPYDRCDTRDALMWPDAIVDPARRDLTTPIQLEGVVGIDATCEDHECLPDDPCCQRCQGSYSLALVTSTGQPLTIGLRTETLACDGTNCGFSCSPLQPGRRYRVWGLWDPHASAGLGTLFYAGHCAP